MLINLAGGGGELLVLLGNKGACLDANCDIISSERGVNFLQSRCECDMHRSSVVISYRWTGTILYMTFIATK